MTFDVQTYLKRATSRAKSDVANKLVSMLLHEISKAACLKVGMSVTDPSYGDTVIACFGISCPYCRRELQAHRAAVEHLEGMNRFRVGLHIPGNVLVSCHECNKEKRRDDQQVDLHLADSGWAQFLSHDGHRCPTGCRTCNYWASILPEPAIRVETLSLARARVSEFVAREEYRTLTEFAAACRVRVKKAVEELYREGQRFAEKRIFDTREMLLKLLEEP